MRSRSSKPQATLVELVRQWAEIQPDSTAYVSTIDGQERSLTYAELDRRARALATRLRASFAPGATAILLFPLGLEFVEAFFACLYAGIVAVPLPPGRGKGASIRLSAVVRDCGARVLLTTSRLAADLGGALQNIDGRAALEVLETDRAGIAADDGSVFAPAPDSLAFLQYTSGSTSEPKGTMVTHENIMANQRMLVSVFETDRSAVIATWLPIFHDMGLIGNVLHAAYLGARAVLVSTLGFIKSPLLWLRTIQHYRADFSGGPNFAYDHCVAKTTAEERAGLDLSGWRVAFNGSEPVRQSTLEAFAAAFAPAGFRKSAFVPTYGLAEATLVVSGNARRGPRYLALDARALEANAIVPERAAGAAQTLVSNGRCDHGDQAVMIVNPDTGLSCSESEIGEIWISGGHVAAGYWQNAAATERTFRATLPGDSRTFLRTGDLGFVSEAELFVTGRIKDLIIFRGRKLYPQDVELTVERACPQVRSGFTAAFTAGAEGTSGIVVVAELGQREDAQAVRLPELALRIQEEHELPVSRLLLVPRSSVPKTTSGKIMRHACKAALASGGYRILAEWRNPAEPPERHANEPSAESDPVLDYAARWIARLLCVPVESVGFETPITALGVDSINKVALALAVEERFGVAIPESSFFAIESLNDLRRFVSTRRVTAPAAHGKTSAVLSTRAGEVVLPAFSAMNWRKSRD